MMPFKKTYLILFSALGLGVSSSVASSNSGDLRIVISGFANSGGAVKIGLVSTEKAYDARQSVDEGFRGVTLTIQENKVIHTFKGIPYGEYAIKYYHDENGNDHLDTNFLGIPKEPYGFSNNARGILGPPNFEKAKFDFGENNTVHEMKLGDS